MTKSAIAGRHVLGRFGSWALVLLLLCRADAAAAQGPAERFVRAADLSVLPSLEARGAVYRTADGTPRDPLVTLYEAGCNSVRLRLWNGPATPQSGFEEVAALARRARSNGMSIWLALHYADTWADPGSQPTPSAWTASAPEALADSVFAYTSRVVSLLRPEIVQIGNEINAGLLWPVGHHSDPVAMITLLAHAVRAVRESSPTTQIMIHHAGHAGAREFLERLRDLDYDLIGLSYYPMWHGKDLGALGTALHELGRAFEKDVLVAETAYPFTLGWSDATHNVVGLSEQLVDGHPASPEGHATFLATLRAAVEAAPRGRGFCYWAPDWIALEGSRISEGSPWENQALWDFEHRALPAISVFAPRRSND
jgi:arabinogalactan endo-1,4-beta-galactosidase